MKGTNWFKKFRSLPLAVQLAAGFALVALIPLSGLALIASQSATQALTARTEESLSKQVATIKTALDARWAGVQSNIQNFASSSLVEHAMKDLASSFDSRFADGLSEDDRSRVDTYYAESFGKTYAAKNDGKEPDLSELMASLDNAARAAQLALIVNNPNAVGEKDKMLELADGSDYAKAHGRIHESLRSVLLANGYYDIFLINAADSRVVYTVFKELDFGTKLDDGPWAKMGLADAYREAMKAERGQLIVSDFKLYQPSYDDPAMFIATPVFEGDQRIGVYAVQVPLDVFDAYLSTDKQSPHADAMLVGGDGLLRSTTNNKPDEYNVKASFRHPTTIRIDSLAVAMGQQGKPGVTEDKSYRGTKVLAAYHALHISPSITWTILLETDKDYALAAIGQQARYLALVGLGFALVSIGFGWLAGRRFAKPIRALSQTMHQVAEHGDFSLRATVDGAHEIQRSSINFNRLLEAIQKATQETSNVVEHMADGDFSKRVESHLEGDLAKLASAVNLSTERAEHAMAGVALAANRLALGHFTFDIDSNIAGEFGQTLQKLAHARDEISRSMVSIASALDALAVGNFNANIDDNLPGELGTIARQANESLKRTASVLHAISESAGYLAQGQLGDAASVLDGRRDNGEFGVVVNHLGEAVGLLSTTVDEAKIASDQVDSGASEISEASMELSQRVERQAGALEQAAGALVGLDKAMRDLDSRTADAVRSADHARKAAHQSNDSIEKSASAMTRIAESSRKIGGFIETINGIAFQTNLLALNAAVEAARAGEQGRGFAVVATEIRNLAQRAATSAREIATMVKESNAAVEQGGESMESVREALQSIVKAVDVTETSMREIGQSVSVQVESIADVSKTAQDLDQANQQNAALVEELSAAANSARIQADTLNTMLRRFETSRNETHSDNV